MLSDNHNGLCYAHTSISFSVYWKARRCQKDKVQQVHVLCTETQVWEDGENLLHLLSLLGPYQEPEQLIRKWLNFLCHRISQAYSYHCSLKCTDHCFQASAPYQGDDPCLQDLKHHHFHLISNWQYFTDLRSLPVTSSYVTATRARPFHLTAGYLHTQLTAVTKCAWQAQIVLWIFK